MHAEAYFLTDPGGPLTRRDLDIPSPGEGETVVEVMACGMCHTDLSFASGAVAPKHELPLVLGHEIVGTVVEAGVTVSELQGRAVLVPAVLPCGECEYCRSGRSNICPQQKMPGNDCHGGFATHVKLPGRFLVPVDDAPASVRVDELSVVADAVSTAYQAILRAGLEDGDLAVVVGAGGVGGFLLQIAKALGARTIGCDVSSERLEAASQYGADEVFDLSEGSLRDHRGAIRKAARATGIAPLRHRIFECSGTAPGQELAYSLLGPAATLLQVGFTRDKLAVRLSNLMAFDATVHGSWGCPPDAYPAALKLIYEHKVQLSPFIEHASLDEVNRLLDDMAHHRLTKRMVLHPPGTNRPEQENHS